MVNKKIDEFKLFKVAIIIVIPMFTYIFINFRALLFFLLLIMFYIIPNLIINYLK